MCRSEVRGGQEVTEGRGFHPWRLISYRVCCGFSDCIITASIPQGILLGDVGLKTTRNLAFVLYLWCSVDLGQETRNLIHDLPFSGCTASMQFFHLFKPQFAHLQKGTIFIPQDAAVATKWRYILERILQVQSLAEVSMTLD